MTTSLKTKIEAAKEQYLRNPYRTQGNPELEHKEVRDIYINTIVDYFTLFEGFVIDNLDKHQVLIEKLELRTKSIKKDKSCLKID